MKALHPNSVQAYWQGKPDLFPKRHQAVIGALRASCVPLTDREVMTHLDYSDPNMVRPRITELIEAGVVEQTGNVRCPITGKTVRLVKLARREAQAEFDLGLRITPEMIEALSERRTA